MKFQSLKLASFSLVAAIAFTNFNSFAVNSDAMGRSASANAKKIQGVANPAVQVLVNDVQDWIFQKAHNANLENTKISIREVKPGTYVHSGNIPVTQEIVRDQTVKAFTDIGYNIPISRLLQHVLAGMNRASGVSVADLLAKDEKFISDYLTKGDVEKTKAIVQLQAEVRAIAQGKMPVQAKVLGAEQMIADVCRVRASYMGCSTGISQKPRMKVTVVFFGELIQKFADLGGKSVAEDLEKLNNTATVEYFFVQGQSPTEWLLEEVVSSGTGLISSKTGFSRVSM